jgi:hypothetical protein
MAYTPQAKVPTWEESTPMPPRYKLDTPKRKINIVGKPDIDSSLLSNDPAPEDLLAKKQVIGFSAIGVFGFAVMFVIAAACPATKK